MHQGGQRIGARRGVRLNPNGHKTAAPTADVSCGEGVETAAGAFEFFGQVDRIAIGDQGIFARYGH
jgi:hypothetical protein